MLEEKLENKIKKTTKDKDYEKTLYILKKCYEKGITDEYLPPIKTNEFVKIKNGDVIIWLNLTK